LPRPRPRRKIKTRRMKSASANKLGRTAVAPDTDPDGAPLQLSLIAFAEAAEPEGLMGEDEFKSRLAALIRGPVTIVLTHNRSSLINVLEKSGVYEARIQHAFRAADRRVMKALAAFINRPDKRSRRIIDEFMQENAPLFEQMGRSPQRIMRHKTRGRFRDLAKVLAKVRKEYGLKIPGVKITWAPPPRSGKGRSIKFGSWCKDTRTVSVHPYLDSPEAPDYFVEYIVYHELLHAVFPPFPGENGRRTVHGPEFKRRERKFKQFKEALAFESRFFESKTRRKG